MPLPAHIRLVARSTTSPGCRGGRSCACWRSTASSYSRIARDVAADHRLVLGLEVSRRRLPAGEVRTRRRGVAVLLEMNRLGRSTSACRDDRLRVPGARLEEQVQLHERPASQGVVVLTEVRERVGTPPRLPTPSRPQRTSASLARGQLRGRRVRSAPRPAATGSRYRRGRCGSRRTSLWRRPRRRRCPRRRPARPLAHLDQRPRLVELARIARTSAATWSSPRGRAPS